MAINIDASRYRQCSASCCEVLYSAESHPLEGRPWHLGIHNGTSEYGITFQRGNLSGISLEVFADADYASKATDRRSVSGGLIMYVGFPGLRNALPFRLQKRSMLLSETQ